MITPTQIKEMRLSTVQDGGYDKEEVNNLLADIIDSYGAVFEENKELYRKMEVLAGRIEEYRAEEDSIKTALITAQKMADRISREAKEKADSVLGESASSAQKTVLDAKEKADKMISEARSYASEFTREKQAAAESIIDEAEKKANDAIDGAKVVAQNILNQAKELSEALLAKAKTEKEYHEDLVAKLKEESSGFKNSLLSLYASQIDRLRELVDFAPETQQAQEKIQTVETEMDQIISNIDEINKLQAGDTEPVQANDAAVQAPQAQENPEDGAPGESTSRVEENAAPEIVNHALDAFSADEITPIDENAAPYIAEIEEEPEMEPAAPKAEAGSLFDEDADALPFENYFHIKKEEKRTEETISLIPPDDYDEEEDEESPKFKGFFKKKK